MVGGKGSGMVDWSGFVYGCGMVDRSRFVNWSGVVNRSGFMHGSGMVRGSGLVNGSGMVSGFVSGLRVVGFASVLYISDVSRVVISDMISYGLGTTIGQQNVVLAVGSVTIAGFVSTKMETSVIILDGIAIVVVSGSIFVSGFMVRRSGMVGRSGLVNGCRVVSGSWVVNRFVNWVDWVDWVNWVDWVDRVNRVDRVDRVDRMMHRLVVDHGVGNRVVSDGKSSQGKEKDSLK